MIRAALGGGELSVVPRPKKRGPCCAVSDGIAVSQLLPETMAGPYLAAVAASTPVSPMQHSRPGRKVLSAKDWTLACTCKAHGSLPVFGSSRDRGGTVADAQSRRTGGGEPTRRHLGTPRHGLAIRRSQPVHDAAPRRHLERSTAWQTAEDSCAGPEPRRHETQRSNPAIPGRDDATQARSGGLYSQPGDGKPPRPVGGADRATARTRAISKASIDEEEKDKS